MTDVIITAAIVVAGLGLACSLLLVLASHFMGVKTNPVEGEVRDCLPGANCGGCGFAGCDDYAANLVADEGLACTKCSPGGAAVAAQIAEILGRSAGASEPQVAQVMCNGTCDASRTVLGIPENLIYLASGIGIGTAQNTLYNIFETAKISVFTFRNIIHGIRFYLIIDYSFGYFRQKNHLLIILL